jgi:hypothetical protein
MQSGHSGDPGFPFAQWGLGKKTEETMAKQVIVYTQPG